METKSKREEIVEVANKLFIYTDEQLWDKLVAEVFKEKVFFDMASAGGGAPTEMKSSDICAMWETGFKGIDYIHHQAGNHIVMFDKDEFNADVICYAMASHYKNAAAGEKSRTFTGSYDLHFVLTDLGWRIDGFKYNLKYVSGNVQLE